MCVSVCVCIVYKISSFATVNRITLHVNNAITFALDQFILTDYKTLLPVINLLSPRSSNKSIMPSEDCHPRLKAANISAEKPDLKHFHSLQNVLRQNLNAVMKVHLKVYIWL